MAFTRGLPGTLLQSCFQLGDPKHVQVPGVVPLQGLDLSLPLVELHEVAVGPLLQSVEVPLYGSMTLAYQPLSWFGVVANLLRVHSGPSCRSPMKTLNKTDPSIVYWDTPLVSSLQLEFVLVIITLWAQTFLHFSVHVTVHPVHTSTACLLQEIMSKAYMKSR